MVWRMPWNLMRLTPAGLLVGKVHGVASPLRRAPFRAPDSPAPAVKRRKAGTPFHLTGRVA